MTEQDKTNLRVFCLCGQKMQIQPEMYGRPAKCVACHQKWFIPERNEIPENADCLSLRDHPELLRQPGQFVRSSFEAALLGESGSSGMPTPPPITCAQVEVSFDLDEPEIENIQEHPCDAPADSVSQAPADDGAQAPVSKSNSKVVVRKTAKTPLDPLECLGLFFGYWEELQRRKGLSANSPEAPSLNALFDSYERSLNRVQKKLLLKLESEQESTAKQLAVIEDELARLNISLRVGDCPLESFVSQTVDLRRSREALTRHNHNLLAWHEVEDSHMAGGAADVVLESFDERSFEIKLPAPVLAHTDKPLFLIYGDELRDRLHMRSALERRKAEWVRISKEQGLPESAVNEGVAETEAALRRNRACVQYCQARMEQLLLDCENDLKALSVYHNDVVERTAKGQMRDTVSRETLSHIHIVEEDVCRVRNLIKQTLSANSSGEVPEVSSTLVHRLRGTVGKNTLALDTMFLFVAAALIVSGLLLFADSSRAGTDWLGVVSTCVAIGIAAASTVLDKQLRAPVISGLWVALLVILAWFIYQRTATDAYLIMIRNGNAINLPVINYRGWLLVAGAAFSGAGTGLALAHYLNGFGIKSVHTATVILFMTLFSSITVITMHTIAPRTTVLALELADFESESSADPEEPNSRLNTQQPDLADAALTSTIVRRDNSTDNEEHVLPAGAGEDLNNNDDDTINDENRAEAENVPDNLVMFGMHGVVHGDGTQPLFRASLSFPDGRTENSSLRLGDMIFGDWKAHEYNRYTKTLTISNGTRLLVLHAGDRVALGEESFEEPS